MWASYMCHGKGFKEELTWITDKWLWIISTMM